MHVKLLVDARRTCNQFMLSEDTGCRRAVVATFEFLGAIVIGWTSGRFNERGVKKNTLTRSFACMRDACMFSVRESYFLHE